MPEVQRLKSRCSRRESAYHSLNEADSRPLLLLGSAPRVDNFPALRHPARMAKPALGRGLGALLGGNPVAIAPAPAPSIPQPITPIPAPDNRERVLRVPLAKIRPSALQPRKEFSHKALRALSASLPERGILRRLLLP